MGTRRDLSNTKFGMLSIIKQLPKKPNEYSISLCLCSCGKKKKIRESHILSGHTTSCGCKKVTHGHSVGYKRSREYASYSNMINRCYNENVERYAEYGARGIRVCKRWRDSFENFLADMGERPAGKTLDRIKVDKNYTPKNCRWATAKQQAGNKTTSRRYKHDGQTLTIYEWGQKIGISSATLRRRLDSLGWSISKTLTTPLKR